MCDFPFQELDPRIILRRSGITDCSALPESIATMPYNLRGRNVLVVGGARYVTFQSYFAVLFICQLELLDISHVIAVSSC